MSIDLSTYSAIQTALFVKVVVPEYETLTFSSYQRNITLDGTTYTGLGQLLAVTDTTSEIRATSQELTISLSGIPSKNITDFMNYKIKGSRVTVSRAIFDPQTGGLLAIAGNPTGRFTGLVNNYSLEESWEGLESSTTITLVCSSIIGQLQSRVAGRKTNPVDQKRVNPYDLSFDRIPSLARSRIQFGG